MKKVLFLLLAWLTIGTAGHSQTAGGKCDVRLIRNATLKINYSEKTILLDPMLGEKGTEMSALGVNMNPRVHLTMPVSEILDGIDFVLLTHSHIDHYDGAAKRLIPKDTPWYVQPADYDTVAVKEHFTKTTVIDDSTRIGDITVVRIEGSHGRGQLGKKMGASSGYVLKAKGQPTLYIMGDCVWDGATRRTVETYRPDYVVVNSGGAILPPMSKTDGPIIPNETETMRIIDESPAGTMFIAVHMDAVDHCQTTRAILRNEAMHHGVDMARLIIPEDGETVMLETK